MSCELDTTELLDKFETMVPLIRALTIGTFTDARSVIETLAIANQLSVMFDELSEIAGNAIGKQLICVVMNQFDASSIAGEYDRLVASAETLFGAFEGDLEAIPADGSLADIENSVDRIFAQYQQQIEQVEMLVKETLKTLLSPLAVIGATEAEISAAVDNVELTTDVQGYALDVFNNLLQLVFQRVGV